MSQAPTLDVDLADSTTISQRIIQVALFLQATYVESTVLQKDRAVQSAMRDTARRLLSYPWVFPGPKEQDVPDSRKEFSKLKPAEAATVMEEVANFFEKRDRSVREEGGPDDIETGLANYLRFAAKYTERLLQQTREPLPSSALPDIILPAEHRERSPVPSHAGSSAPEHACGTVTPNDLRPTPISSKHVPHVLQGSRYSSRYQESEWTTLADHPPRLGRWTADFDEHNTVRIGHDPGVKSSVCEADFLGLNGIKYLRLVHPVCAIETKSLDIDALRFVQILLEHRVLDGDPNGLVASSTLRKEAQAEWQSLEIIRRELAIRQWESKRMALREISSPILSISQQSTDMHTPVVHTSHDLRPTPFDNDYLAQDCQIRRLESRSWFDGDLRFAELIGKPLQWEQPRPEDFEVIAGGRDFEACAHFVDAAMLGISGLNILQLQHPLDARAVRALDIDVLRFIRLALWDWVDAHATCVYERQSLEIVRRELACRRWEKKRATEEAEGIRADSLISTPGEGFTGCEGLVDLIDTDTAPENASSLYEGQAAARRLAGLESWTSGPEEASALMNSLKRSGETTYLCSIYQTVAAMQRAIVKLEAEVKSLRSSMTTRPEARPSISKTTLHEPILLPELHIEDQDQDFESSSSTHGVAGSDSLERTLQARNDLDELARYIIDPALANGLQLPYKHSNRSGSRLRSSRGRSRLETAKHV